MKKYQKTMAEVFDDFLHDYGTEALFDELFPNRDPAEVFVEMYDQGMIPTDVVEKFLEN